MTSDARNRIEQSLRRAYQQGRNEIHPSDENARVEVETDRIIQLVRQAMLGEDALAPLISMLYFHHGDFTDLGSIPTITQRAVQRQLDAAFGEKGTTTPQR